MHQALYRKWRSRTFDDVCGQEHVTSVLQYEVAHGAVNHAYLFCGSRGVGKTTCAKILAKAINCEQPQNGNPCGRCEACLSIEHGTATDVLEMDAASNNGVDNIRDIRDEVAYTPSTLRYRVYIVDEVHMLSTSAFNALLKTLEEPPAHVVFILATTELQKLPATIISRCQRFDFRRISVPVLTARVEYIAREEGISITGDAALRIAHIAQGGMRDAISLLELCGSTGRPVDLATVEEMTGTAGRGEIFALLRAVADEDYAAIFGSIADVTASARDVSVFWQDLMGVYRDLLVLKTAQGAAVPYLDLTDAETTELSALAARFSKAKLLAHCRLLEEAFLAMGRAGAVKRMIAELTLVRLCDPSLDTSPEGLLARIEKIEDTIAGDGCLSAPAPAPQRSQVAPTPAAPAPAAPQAKPSTPRAPQRLRGFANCVERVRRENPMAAPFLEKADAVTDANGTVIVRFPNALAADMATRENGEALLRRALAAELGHALPENGLRLEVADAKSTAPRTPFDELLAETDNRKGEAK